MTGEKRIKVAFGMPWHYDLAVIPIFFKHWNIIK